MHELMVGLRRLHPLRRRKLRAMLMLRVFSVRKVQCSSVTMAVSLRVASKVSAFARTRPSTELYPRSVHRGLCGVRACQSGRGVAGCLAARVLELQVEKAFSMQMMFKMKWSESCPKA
jgi:hypothetical protein